MHESQELTCTESANDSAACNWCMNDRYVIRQRSLKHTVTYHNNITMLSHNGGYDSVIQVLLPTSMM